MRLDRLAIRSFRGVGDDGVRLALDGAIHVVVAPNGRGKSSILNAVEWALFGDAVARKSGLGIDERQGWVTGFRGGRPEVEIGLRRDDEVFRLLRTSSRGGQKGAPELRLEGPSTTRRGSEAHAWLDDVGMPDLREWQRAFCHHQELPRQRVLAGAERTAVLGSLLGLEPYARLRERLAALRAGDILKEVAASVDELGRSHDVVRSATVSGEAVLWEEALSRRGIPRGERGEAASEAVSRRMVERARAMAESLAGGDPASRDLQELPDPADGAAVRAWAVRFPAQVRKARHGLGGDGLFGARRRIQAALEHLREAEMDLERWREQRRALEREHGTSTELDAGIDAVRGERDRVVAERERADAVRGLRERARAVLRERPSDHCPVCASETGDLLARLESLLAERDGDAPQERQDQAALDERLRLLESHRRELQQGLERERRAQSAVGVALEALRAELPGAGDDDPRLVARDRLAGLEREIRAVEEFAAGLERQLDAHETDAEILRELAGWQLAVARERRGVPRVPTDEAEVCERAWDEMAAFGLDLVSLAEMAREIESDASDRRVAEVHGSIGTYMEPMCGARWRDVRLHVKRTRTRLTYEFLDPDGADVLPILNQASLNALSLAVLCAQAEARLARGLPAFLVLDDPAQSLDDEHALGLARALQAVAQRGVPIVAAAPPGRFAEALCDTSLAVRRWELLPFDDVRGVRVREGVS